MISLDKDDDGLVETERSGNPGSLVDPDRGETWWDAVAAGNKNAYLNLLVYRALRNMSDLERKLGHTDHTADYDARANALRRAFHQVFFNPDTGWYGWWRDRDGQLHDYASPFINGMAIEYGVVDAELGREVLARLADKMDEVGFDRFDLGVPVTLIPIPRDAYLKMASPILGASAKKDGSDGFQHYMNGSTNACFTLPYLAALYVVGKSERADKILQAMLKRQTEVGFQNGKRQAADAGIEWAAWDGSPSGADGYLADTYQFMQAVMLREPELRARWYRPMRNQGK
jgi:hypothetical protein